MKRSHILLLFGTVVAVAGYLGFPAFFAYLRRPSGAKHIEVSTAKAAAVHIATSDPKTTLIASEENGVVYVIITKMKEDGDYVDGRISVAYDDLRIGLLLSQRKSGIITIFKEPDTDGFPTRKSVSTAEGVRSYQRRDIEWIEPRPAEKKPNQ